MGAAGGEESVSAVPIPIARKIKLDQQVLHYIKTGNCERCFIAKPVQINRCMKEKCFYHFWKCESVRYSSRIY
jgi:hypothetical protein